VDSRTIVAISSPPGPGRRGILRLSGGEARAIANRALEEDLETISRGADRASFRASFDDGIGRQPALVFWMPGPRSYTGEDVVEFHLPGAAPLLARSCQRLLELGAYAAAPGEFTRRAFLNGRIDLTRAEGVLELVQSTNDAERRSALRLLEGGLSRRVLELRDGLDEVRALCEASLDFDEVDAGHVPLEELARGLSAIEGRLAEARAFESARQTPEALPRVALAGAPNAGKSSLWNALVEGGAALVSEEPGTTRDVLVGPVSVGRGDVLLVDLAGQDPRARGPDELAQRRAAEEREVAALVLWVIDGTRLLAEEAERVLAEAPGDARVLLVVNQVDRMEERRAGRLRAELAGSIGGREGGWVSARDGTGLDALRGRIAEALGLAGGAPAEQDLSRELFLRHRSALERASELVGDARARLAEVPLDISAETLREATRALDEISGRTSSEDLLDRIFARFCLGK